MQKQEFEAQLGRLKSQWPTAYGQERIARLWTTFQRVNAAVFERMVDRALDTMRGAPLAEDLAKLEQEIGAQDARSRVSSGLSQISVLDVFNRAEKADKRTDRDYVRACKQHLMARLDKRITMEQFLEGCDALDDVGRRLG